MARAKPRGMQPRNEQGVTMDYGTPVLTEQASDRQGDYEQQWYCQPPPPGVAFMVTDAAWSPDHTIRRIFAVSFGHGSEKR